MANKLPKSDTVLERFLLPNPLWQEGYRSFNDLFGKPLGFVFIIDEKKSNRLIRLDRKDFSTFYSSSADNAKSYDSFLNKYCELYAQDEKNLEKFPCFFRDSAGMTGAIFAMLHLGTLRGFVLLTAFSLPQNRLEKFLKPFENFLATHVDLAYRSFELDNFYETVHPRALALSTMHSVHRVISASLRLHELLPRIARLSAQVLKARGCSILLCDAEHHYLLPQFSLSDHPHLAPKKKVKIGRGILGGIAKTGDFHCTGKSIGVPFIEDDVVGVMVLWEKLEGQKFTRTDLEILKSLSEQAVVAIKNAQLYEETEQLTLGSIKTINELLALNLSRQKSELPIMLELILEVGRDLGLSHRDLTYLERAVMLIDAGVLVSPEKVWHKKGKLTKREFGHIKQIPMRGAKLLRSMTSLKPFIPVILHYRERFDGKGYPEKLKGEEIPIGARIVSVVDSFVAMISHRSYRVSLTLDEAVKEIKANRGTQFDPHVVDCFLGIIKRPEIWAKLKVLCLKTMPPRSGQKL